MKGVSITQAKDWTPEQGMEGCVETLHETFPEAQAVWDATDKDVNYISIWKCNDVWFDRKCVASNYEN